MNGVEVRRGRPGPSLTGKLGVALAAVGAGMVAFLLLSLGPHATGGFQERSDQLIERGAAAMRELSADGVAESRQLLQSLIEHTTDARSRMLADLPLALYAGDVEALREAVRVRDEARGARQRGNVEILAAEMSRRTAARIDRETERISAESQALAAGFAADMRRQHLLLTGSVFGALVLLLGLGLWRSVVRPVRQLSRATHAVARGDLDVAVATGRRRGDEVGALAVDFAAMVSELRTAREELHAKNVELAGWNENLEREVQRKTGHLERAVADLQRAQAQLVQAARLASVGTLAGGIAHEFGNLIAGINGCAREALQDVQGAEQREPLEVILRAADRAATMTRDLLRFARRDVEPEQAVDLAAVASEALGLLEPHARRLGVEVVRVLHEGVWVRGDAAALHQVIVNLVTNALQAVAEAQPNGGGRVEIEVRRREPNGAEIVVSDDGRGIPSEHLGSVFDPFFTTKDRETDSFRRGTGLGLSVSYGVVEAHGGRIQASSEPGQGACFVVELPASGESDE